MSLDIARHCGKPDRTRRQAVADMRREWLASRASSTL